MTRRLVTVSLLLAGVGFALAGCASSPVPQVPSHSVNVEQPTTASRQAEQRRARHREQAEGRSSIWRGSGEVAADEPSPEGRQSESAPPDSGQHSPALTVCSSPASSNQRATTPNQARAERHWSAAKQHDQKAVEQAMQAEGPSSIWRGSGEIPVDQLATYSKQAERQFQIANQHREAAAKLACR